MKYINRVWAVAFVVLDLALFSVTYAVLVRVRSPESVTAQHSTEAAPFPAATIPLSTEPPTATPQQIAGLDPASTLTLEPTDGAASDVSQQNRVNETPSQEPTSTHTPQPSPTATLTLTPQPSLTTTPTRTATTPPTASPDSRQNRVSQVKSEEPNSTNTSQPSPTATFTRTPQPSYTETPTWTVTASPTATNTVRPTDIPTLTSTPQPTLITDLGIIATNTALPTLIPSPTLTPMRTPQPLTRQVGLAKVPVPPPTATNASPKVPVPPPTATYVSDGEGCAPHGFPVSGILTQRFSRWHPGLDLAVNLGTPVLATHSGMVVFAGFRWDGYGNLVIIQNGRFITYYAHNHALVVNTGQIVHAGQLIALSGSTGWSSGAHVHYETHIDNVPVDPSTLDARGLRSC